MNLTVLGAGAWGTALATHSSALQPTRLWARDAAQATRMRSLRRTSGGLVVIATPMAGLDEMLRRLPAGLDAGIFWLCKGFQDGTAWLGHEVARVAAPAAHVGVLSGPSFAIEVARGQPTALVAASTDASLREAAVSALHAGSLRIYTSADPVGVEVGGAVKNVMAIATGSGDGMALGLN